MAATDTDPQIPVLLVHGYSGAPSQMQRLADRLRRDGRPVTVVSLPARGTLDIGISALAVAAAAHSTGASEVDVVGYSLGGIAAREWLADQPGMTQGPQIRVRHLVLLAGPSGGVRLPGDSGAPEQPQCLPTNACGELAPGSGFLQRLNASPLAHANSNWLTVASSTDGLVEPPMVVALPAARNVLLQNVCPDSKADHGAMASDPAIVGMVSMFLATRLPVRPSCAQAVLAAAA